MRKTIIGVLFVISLGFNVLVLVGCGGGGSTSPTGTPPSGGYSIGPALIHALPMHR